MANDNSFVPEPVPDNIADTELNGLSPVDSDESAPVETEQVDTTSEDATESTDDESDDDSSDPEDTAEEPDKPADEATQPEEITDPKEVARLKFEERQAAKAQRNFVDEERQRIREYEKTANLDDVTERMRILEAKQYVDTVERNRVSLINDNMQAQATIPLFNPSSPEWKQGGERIYQRALERFNESYTVTDPETGEVIGAMDRNGNNVSLFQYLKQEADEMSDVLGTAQRQSQKSEAKMRAKAVNPSNPGKVSSSGDELDDLLDKIGDVRLAG